ITNNCRIFQRAVRNPRKTGRNRLLPEESFMSRLARLEKETSEAKVAVAMGAPRHQKLKELSEGIVEMFRIDPELTAPLMAIAPRWLADEFADKL
ncbi:hypothetical protein FK514_28465, partial [Klebsiella pneumoniae]|uniref:toxin YdaT family protein n=1 Tax=Klebsiella pneumoniae TaxID=573 RepID=UPI00210EBC12